jgi:His/Glu/Gln/Arg/opine family amino acid ABC transporter permease subunit
MSIDFSFMKESFFAIWKAVPLTLELTAGAFLAGLLLGVIIALIRFFHVRILEHIFRVYVSVIRGTPMLLQLYIVYYAIPMIVDSYCERMGWSFRAGSIPSDVIVIIALSISMSAYLSETVRSGLEAVSAGEIEAAYTLGMKPTMVIRRVILPQAFRVCLPNFATQLINVLHGSSLAFYVTLLEITGTAQILAQDNWKYLETYLSAGIIYWLLTIVIEVIAYGLEKAMENRRITTA